MSVRRAAFVLLALALTGCGTGHVRSVKGARVLVLVMENKEQGDVIGAPGSSYVTGLARRYGLATQSYAVTHPSLPNYLALTSGSTQGITTDCVDCHVDARNIVDQLEAAGLSWKAYMQGLPEPCYRGGNAGRYAKKHDPFAYYDDVMSDPARCRRIVPWGDLEGDLRRGSLPAYSLAVPDLCADTHDCGVATGDRFLAQWVPRILHALGPHGLLVLTWDEGSTDAGCCGVAHGGRIATVVAGPDVRGGARLEQPIDHYGVLRSIEDLFGLPHLGAAGDGRNGSLGGLLR